MTLSPTSFPADDDPLGWARAYAQAGHRVIPIRPGSKHPPILDWVNLATTDAPTITRWWGPGGRYQGHGIGIATGTNGRFVLDIDEHGDIAGSVSLTELCDTYGPLPYTAEARTGSGGRHLWLQAPDGITITNGMARHLGPGLDIRGVGGQVVVCPSIHPASGLRYSWAPGQCLLDHPVADAPGWLIAILTREPVELRAATPLPPIRLGNTNSDRRERAGDWFNNNTTWQMLLETDGWTRGPDGPGGEQRWRRPPLPGEGPHHGISATVGQAGGDGLHVFTKSAPHLAPDENYTRWGYYAATRHGGDHKAAAREIDRTMMPARDLIGNTRWTPPPEASADEAAAPPIGPGLATWFIDWTSMWAGTDDAEWLVEPLLAEGRGHALYAKAKSGKSLLLLEVCAAIATGRAVLGRAATTIRTTVLYLDMEMTAGDVRERLEAMGYGPDDNLDNLHYASLPSLPPLNTPAGAQVVLEAVDLLDIKLVVIDTTSRVVVGEENSADTFRELYQHLGLPLKARGVTYCRLDHAGKTAEQGQRGSSAKNDDVDVVWEYTRMEGGAVLKATHRRMGWVPDRVDLDIVETPDLTHQLALDLAVPEGTAECVAALDRLGLPDSASRRACAKALREVGGKAGNSVIGHAVKSRRRRLEGVRIVSEKWSRTTPTDHTEDHPQGPPGPHAESAGREAGTTAGTTADHYPEPNGDQWPPLEGGHGPRLSKTDTEFDLF